MNVACVDTEEQWVNDTLNWQLLPFFFGFAKHFSELLQLYFWDTDILCRKLTLGNATGQTGGPIWMLIHSLTFDKCSVGFTLTFRSWAKAERNTSARQHCKVSHYNKSELAMSGFSLWLHGSIIYRTATPFVIHVFGHIFSSLLEWVIHWESIVLGSAYVMP